MGKSQIPMRNKPRAKKSTGKISERDQAMLDIQHATRHRARVTAALNEIVARQLGLTVSDLLCLDFLQEYGSATAGQLAELTGLTTGAISGLISRLERFGQIVATRSTTDKRQVIIKPVPEKMQWFADIISPLTKDTLKLQAKYSVQELKTIGNYSHQLAKLYQKRINELLKKDSDPTQCICCRGANCPNCP